MGNVSTTSSYRINILKEIEDLCKKREVKDIKVKILSKYDVDIIITVDYEKDRVATLIDLETKMYIGNMIGVESVKIVDSGLAVIDKENSTYKIKVVVNDIGTGDKISDNIIRTKYKTRVLYSILLIVVAIVFSIIDFIRESILKGYSIYKIGLVVIPVICIMILLRDRFKMYSNINNVSDSKLEKEMAGINMHCIVLTMLAFATVVSAVAKF